MEHCTSAVRESNNRSISLEELRSEQQKYHEGSFEWADLQAKINHIIADNLLRYVNR